MPGRPLRCVVVCLECPGRVITVVVGVFPNPEALLRLTTAVLIEQHDEWAASNRRYLSEGSLKALTEPEEIDQGVIRQLDIA